MVCWLLFEYDYACEGVGPAFDADGNTLFVGGTSEVRVMGFDLSDLYMLIRMGLPSPWTGWREQGDC